MSDVVSAELARPLAAVRGPRPADADALAAATWTMLAEPGDGVAGRLTAAYGPAGALERVRAEEPAPDGVSADEYAAARRRWLPRLRPDDLESALRRAAQVGAILLMRGDDEWPERVDDLGDHAPLALWVRGDPRILRAERAVSIVGARAATGYGEHVAAELAATLAADGTSVVSGAAYGIDGAAHRGALGVDGATVALLAGGVDRAYPSGHAELLTRIVKTGVVASETPCGTAPTKWRFLGRNRTIAALGDATIVVEAGARSGSLNTAAHAAALGRPLGAVPGTITSAASAGCHRILRELDGVCITGADDVRELAGFAVAPGATTDAGGRTDDLTRVLDAASTRVARSADELARRSGLAVGETQAILGLAAMEGLVERRHDGWRRVPLG